MNDKLLSFLNSHQDEDLFKLLDLILKENDEKLLTSFIEKNKETLIKENGDLLVKKHLSFYLDNGLYQKAILIANSYLTSDVGDAMTYFYLKDLLEELTNKKIKEKSINIEESLNSENFEENAYAIKQLSEVNARRYLSLISHFLGDKNKSYLLKVLILIILCEQEIDSDFLVNHGSDSFTFNGKNTILPFKKKAYLEAMEYLSNIIDDLNLIKQTKEFISQLETVNFPKSLFENENPLLMAEACLNYFKNNFYHQNIDLSSSGLSKDEYQRMVDKIKLFEEVLNEKTVF